jgi:hypothetical protein
MRVFVVLEPTACWLVAVIDPYRIRRNYFGTRPSLVVLVTATTFSGKQTLTHGPYCHCTHHEGTCLRGGVLHFFFWPRHEMRVSGQLEGPVALPARGIRKVGRSQSRSGSFGEGTNRMAAPRIKPRFCGCQFRSLVTIATKLRCVIPKLEQGVPDCTTTVDTRISRTVGQGVSVAAKQREPHSRLRKISTIKPLCEVNLPGYALTDCAVENPPSISRRAQ